MESTLSKYAPSISQLLIIPCIGHSKTGDYSSFKFTKMFFQKKSLCYFFGQKMERYPTQIRALNFTTVDYPVYWTFKITLSSIGFEWKKVLIC